MISRLFKKKVTTVLTLILTSISLSLIPLFNLDNNVQKVEATTSDLGHAYWKLYDSSELNFSKSFEYEFNFTTLDGTRYYGIAVEKYDYYIYFLNSSRRRIRIYTRETGYTSKMYQSIYLEDSLTSINIINDLLLLGNREEYAQETILGYEITLTDSLNPMSQYLTFNEEYNITFTTGGITFNKITYGRSRIGMALKYCLKGINDHDGTVVLYYEETGYVNPSYQKIFVHSYLDQEAVNFFKAHRKNIPTRSSIIRNDYLLFNTAVRQQEVSVYYFLLNGDFVREGGHNELVDNCYIKFIDTNGNEYILKNCFFEIKCSGFSGFTYAVRLPEECYSIKLRTMTFHLYDGTSKRNSYSLLVPNTFDYSIDVPANFIDNVYFFDCTNKKFIDYTYMNNETIYDTFGTYFLESCPCSGRGDAVDEYNVFNAWDNMSQEGVFSQPRLPEEIIELFQNYIPEGDNPLSEAIRRYDYIVFYKYGLKDFLARKDTVGITYSSNKGLITFKSNEEELSIIIIIVASSICSISLVSLVALFKIKRRQKV